MTTYTIQPGRKAFKPISYRPFFWWVGRTITFSFQLGANCWYWFEGDDDMYDWNKGFGLTGYWTRNDRSAIMWAWRPEGLHPFQMCTYINHPNGKREVIEPFTTNHIAENEIRITRLGKDHFGVDHNGEIVANVNVNLPWLFRPISPWIGGENNEPGSYKSVAPHYMTIKKLRKL